MIELIIIIGFALLLFGISIAAITIVIAETLGIKIRRVLISVLLVIAFVIIVVLLLLKGGYNVTLP